MCGQPRGERIGKMGFDPYILYIFLYNRICFKPGGESIAQR